MSNPAREELLEARLIGLLANIMDFAEGDERDLDVIAADITDELELTAAVRQYRGEYPCRSAFTRAAWKAPTSRIAIRRRKFWNARSVGTGLLRRERRRNNLMTDTELLAELAKRKALIVHCSRPGKGDEG